MKTFSFIFYLLLLPFLVDAQSNFTPGLVVTHEGDTLRGHINHREWLITPASITFKTDANSAAEQTFDATNASYFEISGKEAYMRYQGAITMNHVADSRLTYEPKLNLKTVTVFLKVEQQGGQVDLLSYTDDIKTRFFYQEKDGSLPQELYYHRYYPTSNNTTIITTQKGYVNQLQFLANKYNVSGDRLNREIELALYNRAGLLGIVRKLNNESPPVATVQKEYVPSGRFFTGLAVNRSTIRITDIRGFAEKPDRNPASYLPLLAFGYDYFPNRFTRKLVIRVEGNITAANYQVEREQEQIFGVNSYSNNGYTQHTYRIAQQTLVMAPQLLYNLYNQDAFKWYAGAGAQFNLSRYSENQYTYHVVDTDFPERTHSAQLPDYHYINPYWFSFAYRTGIELHSKYAVYAQYTPYSLISTYASGSMKVSSLFVGVNYHFTH